MPGTGDNDTAAGHGWFVTCQVCLCVCVCKCKWEEIGHSLSLSGRLPGADDSVSVPEAFTEDFTPAGLNQSLRGRWLYNPQPRASHVTHVDLSKASEHAPQQHNRQLIADMQNYTRFLLWSGGQDRFPAKHFNRACQKYFGTEPNKCWSSCC